MALLVKQGITKLSELTIDADKIWLDKGISSIKELALGMTRGDILYHDGTRLVKLSPGAAIGSELMTMGLGHNPYWGFVA